jgi:hypothetical protein
MVRPVLATLVFVLLAGCAATSRDYYGATAERPQTGDLGRIFFVREAQDFMMAAELTVVVNGKRVGTLRNGEAFYRDAKPGRYEVYVASAPDDVVEFRLGPGERAYVGAETAWRMLGFRFVAKPLEPGEGQALVAAVPLVTGLEADLQRADPEPVDVDPRPPLGS